MKYDNNKTKSLADLMKEAALQPKDNKIPIYKGCPNQQCFCTGACREIIGYRDKLPGEI